MRAPRILIIRLSAIGDVLFTLPAYRALKHAYPDAEIDWVVEDKAASVLEGQGLARVIAYPRQQLQASWHAPASLSRALEALHRHLVELRAVAYDAALDLQSNLKSGVHLALARASRKIAFARGHGKEASFLLARELVVPRANQQHRVAKALDLVSVLGATRVAGAQLALDAATVAEARAVIAPLAPHRSLVIVHPGTSAFGAFKRWTPAKFGRVASELAEQHDAHVLVTWGPGEEALAQAVLAAVTPAASSRVTRAPAIRSLLLLAALIAEADLFIGCDSAPLVLASLVNTKAIGLFGPKDPALYGPFSDHARVIRSEVPCSPCNRRQCEDVICMQEIEPDMVLKAACELLWPARGTEPRDVDREENPCPS